MWCASSGRCLKTPKINCKSVWIFKEKCPSTLTIKYWSEHETHSKNKLRFCAWGTRRYLLYYQGRLWVVLFELAYNKVFILFPSFSILAQHFSSKRFFFLSLRPLHFFTRRPWQRSSGAVVVLDFLMSWIDCFLQALELYTLYPCVFLVFSFFFVRAWV